MSAIVADETPGIPLEVTFPLKSIIPPPTELLVP
jgi:hypothetical protein